MFHLGLISLGIGIGIALSWVTYEVFARRERANGRKRAIAEEVALNAGKCLGWNCAEQAGADGYCEKHQ